MTNWSYENTEMALLSITLSVLYLLPNVIPTFSSAAVVISVVGIAFCIYNAKQNKPLSPQVEYHWIVISIVAGAAAYFTGIDLIIYATIYALVRFGISIFNVNQTKLVKEAVEEIKLAQKNEDDSIRLEFNQYIDNEIDELRTEVKEKAFNIDEFHKQMIFIRNKLEEQQNIKLRQIEDGYKKNFSKITDIMKSNSQKTNEEMKQLENKSDRTKNKILSGKLLHEQLLRAFNSARTELDIMSPWITKTIVNDRFKDKILHLLNKGVNLKISYGIENSQYENAKQRNDKTDDFVQKLNIEHKNYKNFHTQKFSSHGKLFICDEDWYIITSMNPLSNDGTLWEEIGELSYNKENLRAYRKYYFNFGD